MAYTIYMCIYQTYGIHSTYIYVCVYTYIIPMAQEHSRSIWKFYNDQAYSNPRDLRLSASWGPIKGSPETPRNSKALEGLKVAPMMPRDECLSYSCKPDCCIFFQLDQELSFNIRS